MIKENRLFLGNPGTGKSTLINCLLGEKKFDAGVNYAVGLSKEYQRFVKGNIAYMDTPGLSDEAISKQAAQAITAALKQGGIYKLFFLVRLQNGRVVSEDIATLERVLDSLDAKDLGGLDYKYTVIINSLGETQYDTMMKRGDEFTAVKTLVNRRYCTESFCFVPETPALQETAGGVADLPQAFRDHLRTAPAIRIKVSQVHEINVDGLARRVEEITKELETLREENTRLKEMMEQDKWLADRMRHSRVVRYHESPSVGYYPVVEPAQQAPYHAIIVRQEPKQAALCCPFQTLLVCLFILAVIVGVVMLIYYLVVYRPLKALEH